ncbi:hypothetical protein BpHYR1_031514 [Brachionus plicatilis]|uniref:Uncharacterized protein n=1 Tax=Brachionus plicatilis TaxID=10195 RepID=A0A3M7T205_BRAPC|nr:hypothetical protein BpHYR1_031514 [Brachionus plicatilis]
MVVPVEQELFFGFSLEYVTSLCVERILNHRGRYLRLVKYLYLNKKNITKRYLTIQAMTLMKNDGQGMMSCSKNLNLVKYKKFLRLTLSSGEAYLTSGHSTGQPTFLAKGKSAGVVNDFQATPALSNPIDSSFSSNADSSR